jgi:heat shock protein HtpX
LTSPPGNLFQQQEANRRRTTWLVIGFVLFFAWLGFGGDYIFWLSTRDADPGRYHHVFPWLGLVFSSIAIAVARYAYRTGPQKVLWATGAREVIDPQDDAERELVNVVEEMAIAAGLPRPRSWIVPDDDPNAFATGHDPNDSHIAVTRGLLTICSRDELQAVIGHELGHVKNLDVRLMTTLAALVGAVLLMRDGMGRMMRGGARVGSFGGGGGGRSGGGGKKGGGGGALIAILLVVWIISWLIAPLVTQLLALAVSRKREYLADAMSAQFTRNPLALASALEKIENAAAPTAAIKRGAAHLCIADPLGRRLTNREGWLADRLASHPPMGMRISRLKGMGYAQLKKEGGATA